MVTEKKPRIFHYDPKEIIVLFVLAVMIGAFAFTLGVHLGKKTSPRQDTLSGAASAPVATVPDQVPTRQELNEQQKGVAPAVDETIKQALHEEVQRSGIRLDQPKQVQLPDEVKTKPSHGGAAAEKPASPPASTESAKSEAHAPAKADTPAEAPAHSQGASHAKALSAQGPSGSTAAPLPRGKKGSFTLQVGSYATASEARQSRENLESFGLKPTVKPVELSGKGTWYRLYVGAFNSKEEAEEMGSRYQSQKQIESFIVTTQ